ncbi:MAG: hypothetical protein AAF891_00455 [Pseudomonadota bacterium]
MLEFLGTIMGNILSLPGILGLAVGLMTRNPALGAGLGGIVGLAEAFAFAGFSVAGMEGMETVISVAVGLVFGTLGTAIRRKGTTI